MEWFIRLRGLREEFNLSQSEVGKALGMHQRKISRLENGETQPTMQELQRICFFYNVSADYILGLTKKRSPYPEK